MTSRPKRSAPGSLALALAVGALGVLSAACSSAPVTAVGGGAGGRPEPAVPAVPLATSLSSTQGSWATLPMGDLHDPLNTFWQLFHLPSGGTSWSDAVEATAVATNGGIVLATGPGAPVVVGVRPSNLLTYSPLVATSDGGQHWATGVLDSGLASRPDALSVGAGQPTLAIVGGSTAGRVLISSGGLSSWRPLVTRAGLAATPAGRSCRVGALDAVAADGSVPLVGATCGRPGAVGLFALRSGRWSPIGPTVPASLGHPTVEVLGLREQGSTIGLLLALQDADGLRLAGTWTGDGGLRWSAPEVLPVAAGEQLESFGATPAGGFFALTATASGHRQLALATPGATAWSGLPDPPDRTSTIAYTSGSVPDALVGGRTVLTVSSLEGAPPSWRPVQTLRITIVFGSSS